MNQLLEKTNKNVALELKLEELQKQGLAVKKIQQIDLDAIGLGDKKVIQASEIINKISLKANDMIFISNGVYILELTKK